LWWFLPVILATREAEVEPQSEVSLEKNLKTLSEKKKKETLKTQRTGGSNVRALAKQA
jgi:hypothetical protein